MNTQLVLEARRQLELQYMELRTEHKSYADVMTMICLDAPSGDLWVYDNEVRGWIMV